MKVFCKRLFSVLCGSVLFLSLQAQDTTIIYPPDTISIFPNPERGWRQQVRPPCCDNESDLLNGIALPPHDPLEKWRLESWRTGSNAITVFKDDIKIQQWTTDIPQSRLDEIDNDFNTIRKAGLKSIVRFLYNWGMSTATPEDTIISRHLDQLAPILQANTDVIFAVEFALLGGTGEAVDAPGYLENNNNGWSSLNGKAMQLYNKLLDIVPEDRMLPIHYPRYKFDMMGWENGNEFPTDVTPLTEETAFTGTDIARIGYYNDNFAGDIDHWGFFNAWPDQEREYVKQDALYVVMQGELSGATSFNKNHGARELRKYRFTAYEPTGDGSNEVISFWKSTGQYDEIARKLGYRFRLIDATLPKALLPESQFNMTMNLRNDGWARIMNPRNVEIVFRDQLSGEEYVINIEGDNKGNRLWLPGPEETKTLFISEPLPAGMPLGTYDLFLNLPDPYPSIHDRPEYSIRIANEGTWEASTGYNSLLSELVVTNELPTGQVPENIIQGMKVYPNPVTDNKFALDYMLSKDVPVNISVFNISGSKLIDLGHELKTAGKHRVTFATENFENGIHLINISVGKMNYYHKVAIVRNVE